MSDDLSDLRDRLHQLWAKTTGDSDTFWKKKDDFAATCVVSAPVDGGDAEAYIATDMNTADAEWVVAAHGSWPQLARMITDALDEAERADSERDGRECRIAELELENQELKAALK